MSTSHCAVGSCDYFPLNIEDYNCFAHLSQWCYPWSWKSSLKSDIFNLHLSLWFVVCDLHQVLRMKISSFIIDAFNLFFISNYCTSVRPGRGIPHMWLSEVYLVLPLLIELRTEDVTPCSALLENCDCDKILFNWLMTSEDIRLTSIIFQDLLWPEA